MRACSGRGSLWLAVDFCRERKCAENYDNNAIGLNLFFKTAVSILVISNHDVVSECCSEQLLPYILFEKYIYILEFEMARPGNQHSANCIGALSFPVCFGCYCIHVLRRI